MSDNEKKLQAKITRLENDKPVTKRLLLAAMRELKADIDDLRREIDILSGRLD